MISLIKYIGEIRCNQVGINYDFPHYSTILGAILAVYHKENNTPKYPRIDMFQLANDLGIELCLFSKNNSNLLLEYCQYRNLEKKITDESNPYSPGHRHIIKGEFYIGIKTNNEVLTRSLTKHPIKIGSVEGTTVEYQYCGFFKDEGAIFHQHSGDLYFLKDKEKYELESTFRQGDGYEVCLVSQIEKPKERVHLQGVYTICEWELLDENFELPFVSYSKLYETMAQDVYEKIEMINLNLKEVLHEG